MDVLSRVVSNLPQILVSGLALGSIYALIAYGYYITYITTGTFNFSQGEYLMFGAIMGVTLFAFLGLPFPIALIGVILVLAAMGFGLERIAIRPLRTLLGISWVLSTVAVGIMLRNLVFLVWGKERLRLPSPIPNGEAAVRVFGVGFTPQDVFIFVTSILAMLGVLFFLRRSIFGKGLMAVAFNRDAAGLMGINVRGMVILAFMISAALAGLAGLLVGPIFYVNADMGTVPGLKAFAAAVLGGLENPVGILIGGLAIGVLELVFATIDPVFRDASVFLVIILVLVVRPSGLLGRRVIEKV